ncbi:hypothetical protein FHR24_002846 [Wenyingzhuangia heitensis]|uniref:Uncharacterized protein n=1 Tax=Wenyingzhuangia heitensis TaxID=1487859 RepID=A0ABX0UDE5_9FLAO|nr:hypothetical protein [Wenyingzhuangia heitensis]NIJ46359.1 hypothetical protein [Wenyingzhuangia heitensis]
MIKYEYFNNGKLLIVKYTGKISKPLLSSFLSFLFREVDISTLENIVADYRDAEMDFLAKDAQDIIKTRTEKANKDHYKIKTIFLVKGPKETAISILFSIALEKSPVFIYSTSDPCLKKISLNMSPEEFDFKIKNLKHSY